MLTESQFAEKGALTPEEFVKAGDMLVLRCPTWQWQAGDPANARPFLPPDKQYLFTRNVPCQRRAASLMSGAEDEQEVDGGDDGEGWLSAHASHVAKAAHDDEVPDMVDATSAMGGVDLGAASSSAAAADEDGLEELGAARHAQASRPRQRQRWPATARGALARAHGCPLGCRAEREPYGTRSQTPEPTTSVSVYPRRRPETVLAPALHTALHTALHGLAPALHLPCTCLALRIARV